MIESPRLSPSIFCCKIKNYIVEGDKLKANHDYRWGGHESVFCKSQNSQQSVSWSEDSEKHAYKSWKRFPNSATSHSLSTGTACTWRGPIRPKLRSCTSEMKNLCLCCVTTNNKALFRNLFHELYAWISFCACAAWLVITKHYSGILNCMHEYPSSFLGYFAGCLVTLYLVHVFICLLCQHDAILIVLPTCSVPIP